MNQVRVLYMLLVLALGGMGAWVWKCKQEQQDAEAALTRTVDMQEAKVAARQQEMDRTLATRQEQHEKLVADLRKAQEEEIEALRKGERQRMGQAFAQFGDILEGNKKTLESLNTLEQKVKSGQDLSKAEAQRLAVIATGLTYLQQQYKKPFREFAELETYLARRANADITAPDHRFSFWKRMFNAEYREQEKEFFRSEGEKRGFQEASEKFSSAYSAAQKQMAATHIDFEKAMGPLQSLLQDKGQPEDLGEFFTQARKALNTHQKLLEFEPEVPKPAGEQPRP